MSALLIPNSFMLKPGSLCVGGRGCAPVWTPLGTCVAAFLYDSAAGIGGLNHFMLAQRSRGAGLDDLRYGVIAMDALLDEVLRAGAARRRLQAKLYGGADSSPGFRVGEQNAAFALSWCVDAGLPVVDSDLGGRWARHLQCHFDTGQARVDRLAPLQGGPEPSALRERRVRPPGS